MYYKENYRDISGFNDAEWRKVYTKDYKFKQGEVFDDWSFFESDLEIPSDCVFGKNCIFEYSIDFGDNCTFGDGCQIGDYCNIGKNSRFGDNCKFESSVSIEENTTIGNNCFAKNVWVKDGVVFGDFLTVEDSICSCDCSIKGCVIGENAILPYHYDDYILIGVNCSIIEDERA